MNFINRQNGLRGFYCSLGIVGMYLLPGVAQAAGGKPATKLVCVADTRAISGISKWIADIYNTNYWLFGLVTVVVMACMGLVLGLIFDRLLSLTGLNLGKLEHRE